MSGPMMHPVEVAIRSRLTALQPARRASTISPAVASRTV